MKYFCQAVIAILGTALWMMSQVYGEEESVFHLSGVVGIAEPEVERREVVVPKIDTEDFELGLYIGSVNIENFGSSILGGLRLAVHATEDFFLEGSYSRTSISDEVFRRQSIPQPLFGSREINVEFYSVSMGYNILPGEVYLGNERVLTSAAYVLLGIGTTSFEDNDNFTTVVLGMGLRVLPNDWLSVRFEAKGHELENDIVGGKRKYTHNIETSFSIGVLF